LKRILYAAGAGAAAMVGLAGWYMARNPGARAMAAAFRNLAAGRPVVANATIVGGVDLRGASKGAVVAGCQFLPGYADVPAIRGDEHTRHLYVHGCEIDRTGTAVRMDGPLLFPTKPS